MHEMAKSTWRPQWAQQGHPPTFIGIGNDPMAPCHAANRFSWLWGNTPAIDVLNLARNEGSCFGGGFNICFAGKLDSTLHLSNLNPLRHSQTASERSNRSIVKGFLICERSFARIRFANTLGLWADAMIACGDLRNVLMTLFKLSDDFAGRMTITMNDNDIYVVLRNLAMILLLNEDDPHLAVDTIIHLWYSARLQLKHVKLIKKLVLQPIDYVVEYIRSHPPRGEDWKYARTFPGTVRVRAVFAAKQWIEMQNILSNDVDPDGAEVSRRSIIFGREDYLHRSLFNTRRDLHRRVSKMQFRERGVLLPFGQSPSGFNHVNL